MELIWTTHFSFTIFANIDIIANTLQHSPVRTFLTFIFNPIDTPAECTIILEDDIGHVVNLLTYFELLVNPITHFNHNK